MNLTDFATELKARNNFIKASFGGFAGSGKTRTATGFIKGAYKDLGCNKPILIIDNEKGSRFLVPLFEKEGITTMVKDTIELADVLKAFEFLNNKEIDFLFIDSLSKVWYKYVRDYRKKNNRTFMTLQDWGKILPAWQETFSDKFVELEGNCVFTGRGGYKYDMEETEENGRTKKEFVKSGVKMKMAGETPFEPDLNIWMDINQEIIDDKPKVWREALVLKDRSDLIDGKVFRNPSYSDFKPVVDYLIDVPKGFVAGSSDKSNLAPSEDFSRIDRKRQREITLENIKAEFDKSALGSSKDDKKTKITILEKIFGLKSWVAIEGMPLEELTNASKELENFMQHFATAEDKEIFIKEYEPTNNLENAEDPIKELFDEKKQ